MDLLPMNPVRFAKMAHGDIPGMGELARDYFHDTRRVMAGWLALLDTGRCVQLREELHRCKGGATLFGLERLAALLAGWESPKALETRGVDLVAFERELDAAEAAVEAFVHAD